MANRWIQRWKSGLCLCILAAFQAVSFASNPFLHPSEKDASGVEFRGTEWNDEYAPKDIPLTAKVVTKEVTKTAWGGVYEISFEDLHSKGTTKRAIPPLYLVVTDEVIALLNEEKMDEAVRRIAALEKAPAFEDTDVYGISKGVKKLADARSKTTVTVKGDICTYLYSHESGGFTKLVWKKGVGLVEYGQGEGARKDGFRLKAEAAGKAAR